MFFYLSGVASRVNIIILFIIILIKVYIAEHFSKNESFNYYLKKNHSSEIGIGIAKQDSEIVHKHPTEKIITVMYFDSIEYINPNENFERLKTTQNLILKKYSKEELKNLNWKINYK